MICVLLLALVVVATGAEQAAESRPVPSSYLPDSRTAYYPAQQATPTQYQPAFQPVATARRSPE